MNHHLATYWPLVPGPKIPVDLYDHVADSAHDADIIIEAGCGFGRGVHYLMEALRTQDSHPKLYAFDTFGEAHPGSEFWEGYPATTPWGEPFMTWAARVGGTTRMLDQFAFYLKNSHARDYLTDWAQFPWWTVAEEFKDGTVSFVIANGAHTAKGVTRELTKWWPKLKPDGKISVYGHDEKDWEVKVNAVLQWMVDAKKPLFAQGERYIVLTKSQWTP